MMIKKYYRKAYRAWLGKKLTREEFLYTLTSLLGIQKGDSVLVHASFGNLKADFNPKTTVEILMEAVGKEGNLLMPYYPYDSKKFLKSGETFDVHTTPTRSGILSATFSTFPEVKKSIHPTKSLAVWGKDRDDLIREHHLSKTPFDERSPYGKLLNIKDAKAIGLGTYKNSFVHSAEDLTAKYPKYYSKKIYIGPCIDYSKNIINVSTPIHVSNSMPRFTGFFINTNCPNYILKKYRKRIFYTSICFSTLKHLEKLLGQNISPKSYYNELKTTQKFVFDLRYRLHG